MSKIFCAVMIAQALTPRNVRLKGKKTLFRREVRRNRFFFRKKRKPFPFVALAESLWKGYGEQASSARSGASQAQERVMDYLFFFVGIIAVICALTYIKKTSPNRHH